MAFSLKDGVLKISSLGITRLEYSLPAGTSNIGLNIGGNDRQNFILGQIIVFDEALDGYDLDRATFMEES